MEIRDVRSGPTPVIDESRARANIARMADKARKAGVQLRPHVKTHQSAMVAGWLREAGVTGLTVSSVDMAEAFASFGWTDLTVAVPLNPHELPRCEQLAADGVRLGLLADHPDTAATIAGSGFADLWLKVDCGYGRAGVAWDDTAGLEALCDAASTLPAGRGFGVLTHAGQSYAARGAAQVLAVHEASLERMAAARAVAAAASGRETLVSVGDTPTCSVADAFPGVDEIRPGNFVLYDLMQVRIGSCSEQDVALHVDCPVIGVRPDTGRLVLHCGEVHMSKDAVVDAVGTTVHGVAVDDDGRLDPTRRLVALSQEHGLLTASAHVIAQTTPGDVVRLVPAHACLVCDRLL